MSSLAPSDSCRSGCFPLSIKCHWTNPCNLFWIAKEASVPGYRFMPPLTWVAAEMIVPTSSLALSIRCFCFFLCAGCRSLATGWEDLPWCCRKTRNFFFVGLVFCEIGRWGSRIKSSGSSRQVTWTAQLWVCSLLQAAPRFSWSLWVPVAPLCLFLLSPSLQRVPCNSECSSLDETDHTVLQT